MRLLFFASNGLGVGHLTRLLSVAHAITQQPDRHEILFLTNSEASPFPEDFPFYAIRLPGRNRARKGGLTAKSYLQTVRPLVLQTIASFDPHILVTDTFPEGPERELLPVMDWPIAKAFIFREQNIEPSRSALFREALRPYNRILIPHDKDSISLPEGFKDDPRVRWTGPIVSPQPPLSRQEARTRLGIQSEEPVFLVSLGGGGDPLSLARAQETAQFLRHRKIPFFYASGPLTRTLPPGIHAREWLPVWPVKPFLSAFDGIIASGGYNTVHELIEVGIPALLMSFPRALDPQEKRVERFVREGKGVSAPTGNPVAFQKALESFLSTCHNRSGQQDRFFPFPGASFAAAEILDLGLNRQQTIPLNDNV
ncbi:MAG: hypothetical protein ACYC9S_11775 [Leptospirales bacterium]